MELNELMEKLGKSASSSYDRNLEKALDRLGLERRKAAQDVILPALGIFGAGIAVGASLGLLFAPKRGEELRSDLRHSLDDLRRRSAEEYSELRQKSEEALRTARERVDEQEEEDKGDSEDRASA